MAEEHPNYRQLNNYDYSNIPQIINYLINRQFPPNLTPRQQGRYAEKFDPFHIQNGLLFFNELEVVPDAQRNQKLNLLYRDRTIGLGHGINQWYVIVSSRYLNIPKKVSTEFLKNSVPYQLTRTYVKPTVKVKRYVTRNAMWQIDLIDMGHYSRWNRGWKFILSVKDLATKQVWLRALRRKTPAAVLAPLQVIVNNQPPEHRVRAIQSDNGLEFEGVLAEFFRESNIKIIKAPSHTPLSEIENLNGQVRKMLNELFTRRGQKHWINFLPDIEANLNNFNAIRRDRDEPENQPIRILFAIGDIVRVRQTSLPVIGNPIRKEIKAGLQKHIHVKYSVDSYIIRRVYRSNHANGLASYTIEDNQGNPILEVNGNISRFKQDTLLKLPQQPEPSMTQEQSNMVNGIR